MKTSSGATGFPRQIRVHRKSTVCSSTLEQGVISVEESDLRTRATVSHRIYSEVKRTSPVPLRTGWPYDVRIKTVSDSKVEGKIFSIFIDKFCNFKFFTRISKILLFGAWRTWQQHWQTRLAVTRINGQPCGRFNWCRRTQKPGPLQRKNDSVFEINERWIARWFLE